MNRNIRITGITPDEQLAIAGAIHYALILNSDGVEATPDDMANATWCLTRVSPAQLGGIGRALLEGATG